MEKVETLNAHKRLKMLFIGLLFLIPTFQGLIVFNTQPQEGVNSYTGIKNSITIKKDSLKENSSLNEVSNRVLKKQPMVAKEQKNSISKFSVGSKTTGFISTWNTSAGYVEHYNQIKLPLEPTGTYNFTVQWGDGRNSTITSWNQSEETHTYYNPGVYTLNITGTLDGWSFKNSSSYPGVDPGEIIQITQWGNLQLGPGGYYFREAQNLVLTATDAPNLNGTTTLADTFQSCFNLGSSGSLNSWNVSQITDFSSMFFGDWNFNQPISKWNVSHAINMSNMFLADFDFNQSISTWNVSKVTDMNSMFSHAHSFNQPLGSWNVSKVTNMANMFSNVSLSSSNYNDLLIGWSSLPLRHDVIFNAGNSLYTSIAAAQAHDKLINIFFWTITDGGYDASPSPPQQVLAISGNSFVIISWTTPTSTGSSPIYSYNIFRSFINSGNFTILASVSFSTLSYNDTSVTNGQTYYYLVRANNEAGESNISNLAIGEPRAVIPTTQLHSNSSNLINYIVDLIIIISLAIFLIGILFHGLEYRKFIGKYDSKNKPSFQSYLKTKIRRKRLKFNSKTNETTSQVYNGNIQNALDIIDEILDDKQK